MGIHREISGYSQGLKVTKSKCFGYFNIAAKWNETYRLRSGGEAWFPIANLPSLAEV